MLHFKVECPVLKLLRKKGGERVLDLGCRSGKHSVCLAKQDFNVYEIDIARSGVEIAKNWLKKRSESKFKDYRIFIVLLQF
ncbi:MAG: hypothetical protein QME57_02065 [Patescibacteria group bacterium]|nr:hypothetical protein [Patescibacteria group bacterium]